MTWYFEGKPFKLNEEDGYFGFVYCIYGPIKDYIGKKRFYKRFSRRPLKGRVNRRRYYTDSDWKDYYGSNRALLADLERLGPKNFRREILRLCKSHGEMNYYETKFQFEEEVLINPDDWYNDWIVCKVHRKHLTT